MRCPKCASDNPHADDARFCVGLGKLFRNFTEGFETAGLKGTKACWRSRITTKGFGPAG